MQHEDIPLLAESHISLLDAGGVELEVVRAARAPAAAAEATPEPLLLLVHGGLFMSGSPRAVRHVAARLSAELGIAVATPKLRLAPEHPYPAALDDLATAYEWLERHGVGAEGAAPPSRLALVAESSGGALALALLHRRHAAGAAPPCALALVSPWLDMTCRRARHPGPRGRPRARRPVGPSFPVLTRAPAPSCAQRRLLHRQRAT